MRTLKLLGISGSLKSTSSNTTILRALAKLANSTTEFIIYNDLEEIPAFNPEKEEGTASVKAFKQLLKEADGVIISTPEYAFGVPGVLKNALDWTVSSGELNDKPVVAISASPLVGDKALASLLLTLSALGTKTTEQTTLNIRDVQNKIKQGEIIHAPTLEQLALVFDQLIRTIEQN